MNECAGGDETGALGVGKVLGRRRRREDVGEDEEPERDTETGAERSAENEDRNAAPKSVHGSLSCVWRWVVGRRCEMKGEGRGSAQRERDPADAGRPAEPVEDLTEDGRADEAAGEVAGEIDAAGRAAVRGGGAADESGRCRLREERPDADQDHAEQDCHELATAAAA